ncbi:MAG: ABC transporter permease [Gemmobacter sp.]|jgi:peptide/nickel transport system permease protein|nr:ABC transporter permease [Gemmobacter sp.]
MLGFALRRVTVGLATLVAVTLLMFLSVSALPGDQCSASLGRTATEGALARCRQEISGQGNIAVRYVRWTASAMTGDLGTSHVRKEPVAAALAPRLFNTFVLASVAAGIAFPLAIVLGVLAALRRDQAVDIGLPTLTLIGMTVPEFVSATMLVLVFSIWLGWLPGISMIPPDAPISRILPVIATPALALAFISMAHTMRMVRSCTIDVLESCYVHMARLRGVPERLVVWRHVLPNAMLPAIGIIALQFATLLAGVVVIKVVFNYPGLGRLTMDAISNRDLPLVLGIAATLAAIYVAVTLVADLLMFALNPRLRTVRS